MARFGAINTNGEIVTADDFGSASNLSAPVHITFPTPFTSSAIDNQIKVTSTQSVNLDIVLHGYKI